MEESLDKHALHVASRGFPATARLYFLNTVYNTSRCSCRVWNFLAFVVMPSGEDSETSSLLHLLHEWRCYKYRWLSVELVRPEYIAQWQRSDGGQWSSSSSQPICMSRRRSIRLSNVLNVCYQNLISISTAPGDTPSVCDSWLSCCGV